MVTYVMQNGPSCSKVTSCVCMASVKWCCSIGCHLGRHWYYITTGILGIDISKFSRGEAIRKSSYTYISENQKRRLKSKFAKCAFKKWHKLKHFAWTRPVHGSDYNVCYLYKWAFYSFMNCGSIIYNLMMYVIFQINSYAAPLFFVLHTVSLSFYTQSSFVSQVFVSTIALN